MEYSKEDLMEAKKQILGVGENMGTEESKKIWEENAQFWDNAMGDETLVLLSHKEPDSRISVKVEFGEKEGQISLAETQKQVEDSKPKAKTTYKQIQKYVEENYGFKVHTAYIAEVKRNLGLPMYDAPNAVEELKRPRSHPTEKMVLAIKETLAHFEII